MNRQLAAAIAATVLGLSSFALTGSAGAAEGGRPVTVELTGAAERPGPGDQDGMGTASLRINPGHGRICYTLAVSDLDQPVAAHIHLAPSTEAGPVVAPLAAPIDGTSTGCVDVGRDLALNIIRNPESYYVNVHTALFPAGAVRGQLG